MLRRFETCSLLWKNARRCFASLPSTGKHAVSQRNAKSSTSSFQYQVIAEACNIILYRPGGLVHLRIQLTICQLSRMSSSLGIQLTFRLQNSQVTMYQHLNFLTDNQCSRYFTETNAHIERIRYQCYRIVVGADVTDRSMQKVFACWPQPACGKLPTSSGPLTSDNSRKS